MNTASKSASGAPQDWKTKLEDQTSGHSSTGKGVLNTVQTGQAAPAEDKGSQPRKNDGERTVTPAKPDSVLSKAEDWTADMTRKVEELDGTVRSYIGKHAIPMAICAVGVGIVAALVQNHLSASSASNASREAK